MARVSLNPTRCTLLLLGVVANPRRRTLALLASIWSKALPPGRDAHDFDVVAGDSRFVCT